ncbi:MAG: SURF1 family protein [Sphingomicrobium sp.]
MIRRVPLIPTLIVLAAAATMIGLGIWQIQRARWKDGIIARYAAAEKMPPIGWPNLPPSDDRLPLYRHATGNCLRVVAMRTVVGENVAGEPGYAHVADCSTGAEGPGMSVVLGWSKNPRATTTWRGGLVSGIIGPDARSRMRLVAATPAPGLAASAPPSLSAIPNNHKGYALQWFAFALMALVIYAIALRQRLAKTPPE